MVKAKLHNYQRYAAEFIKTRPMSGLFLDMGLGKAVDENTIIPTPKGMAKIKNINVGDPIFDRKGNITRVIALFRHKNKKAYEVTLADGRSFICCNEHIIPFYDKTEKIHENIIPFIQSKPLSEMLDDYKTDNGSSSEFKYAIPQNKAVNFDEYKNHKEKPYNVGIILGSNTNDIPVEYMIDSIHNRKQLLMGILDVKGNIKTENDRSQHYSYSSPNKNRIKQLKWLTQSLGYASYVQANTLHIYSNEIIVSNEKLIKKLTNDSLISPLMDMTDIVSIVEVKPRNMICFTVDNDEKLYLINDFIVTHNTLTTLTAFSEMAQSGKLKGNILIIAPKKIAVNTWPDEIEKWDHTKNAKYTVITGLTPKKRKALFDEIETNSDKAQIYIVNRELVPKLVERFAKKWPFPNVILDELQSFKGHSSSRFKSLRKVRNQIRIIVGLTGTPAPNSLMDLWAQITILDGGQRLGPTISAYREAFFDPGRRTPQGQPYEWILKPYADDVIFNRINDIAISMKAADYLQMPAVTYNTIKVKMTAQEKKVYNTLKKEKVLPLIDGSEITSANAAVLTAQLLQLSNGAIYNNATEKDTADIVILHDHKLEALDEIVDQSQGQPLVVFYWYKHDLVRLQKAFPQAETFDGSREHKDKWNRGEVPILLLQPSSSGHGLNLQDGGHIIVWFSMPNWSLELYQQGNARVYRQGQTKPVIIHHIVTENTMDDKVLARLAEKDENQNHLIDAVKAGPSIQTSLMDDLKSELKNTK